MEKVKKVALAEPIERNKKIETEKADNPQNSERAKMKQEIVELRNEIKELKSVVKQEVKLLKTEAKNNAK